MVQQQKCNGIKISWFGSRGCIDASMPNPKALCPCYNCHPSGISVTKTTIKRHLAIQANAYGPGISTPPHLSRPRPVVAPVVAPIAPLPTIRDVVIPVVMIDQVTVSSIEFSLSLEPNYMLVTLHNSQRRRLLLLLLLRHLLRLILPSRRRPCWI